LKRGGEALGDLDSVQWRVVASFIESVEEAREDPQTSTAVFFSATPCNPTVCEPWMHCF